MFLKYPFLSFPFDATVDARFPPLIFVSYELHFGMMADARTDRFRLVSNYTLLAPSICRILMIDQMDRFILILILILKF